MGRNTVILLIFVLESVCVFGFYLSKANNQADVYKVKEDKTSLTIINPKPEKPTLREIIYYHVIETPYEQEQVINQHISETGLKNNNEIVTNNQRNISGNHNFIENEHITGNKDKRPVIDTSVIDKEPTANEHNLIDNDMNESDIPDSEYIDDKDVIDNINNTNEIDFDDDHRKFTNGHGYQYYYHDPENEAIPDDSTDIDDNDKIVNSDSNELEADPINPVDDDDDEMIDTDSTQLADQMGPVDDDDEITNLHSEPLPNDSNIEDDDTTPDETDDNNLDEETQTRIENFLAFLKSVKKPADTLAPIADDKTTDSRSEDDLPTPNDNEGSNLEKHIVTKRSPQNADMIKEKSYPSGIEAALVKTSRKKRELNGKTYGMTLTGDTGVVWNDLNDMNVSFPVGESNNKIKSLYSIDDDVTNEKIAKFKREEPISDKSTKKPSIEEPKTNKPVNEELSTEKSKFEEPIHSDSKKPSKTYGMSLAGDHGTIWNDLNGQRVSYHVGDSTEDNEDNNSSEDKQPFKTSKDDEEINVKIEEFEKDMEKSASKEKPDNEEPSTAKPISEKPTYDESKTEKPTTGKPDNMEPTTEEPNTKEPEKPVKTYGMSLNDDHGIVWNDLNGHRVSYHVGEPALENEENTINNVPEATDLDEILSNLLNPSDNDKDDYSNLSSPSELEAAINDIFSDSKETDKSENNVISNEIIDIIKEVVKNETAKIEEKLSCSDSNENDDQNGNRIDEDNKKDNDIITPIDSLNGDKMPDNIQEVINNEQFWKWLNDWSSAYTELLINRVDMHIKEEVSKQIQEFIATHEYEKTEAVKPGNIDIVSYNDAIDDKKEMVDSDNNIPENVDNDEPPSKKRPDKDNGNQDKEKRSPIKINASNVYGNSVGNGNVTNIFVFNIGNKSDFVNMKPLINGTDGIYVFGNDDENLDTNKGSVELQDEKDKVEAQTTGNQNESSSSVPHDQDTTVNVTDETMETSNENVESADESKVHEDTSSNLNVDKDNKSSESEDNNAIDKNSVEVSSSEESNEDKDKYDKDKHNVEDAENSTEENKNVSEEKIDTDEKTESNDESEINKDISSQNSNEDKDKYDKDKHNEEDAEKSIEENKNDSENKVDTDEKTESNESEINKNTASKNSNEDKDSKSSEDNAINKDSVEVSSSEESNEDKDKYDKDKHNVEDAENSTEENNNVSGEKIDTDKKTESNDESEINTDISSHNSNEDKDSVESSSSEESKEEKDDDSQNNAEDTKNHTANSEEDKVETKIDPKETSSAKNKSTVKKDKHNAKDTDNSKKLVQKKKKSKKNK